MIEIDFETKKIMRRPEYPPEPVGVAIGWPGQGGRRYYAWGHPEENNCTRAEAKKILTAAYRSGEELGFHNSGYDLEVGHVHLDLPYPPWHKVHDTLFEAFLYNPYESDLSLKPLAEKYLDLPPEEQNALTDWLLANIRTSEPKGEGEVRRVCDHKNLGKWGYKITQKIAGAFIAYAPGRLVGRYAVGDIKRTGGLHRFYQRYIRSAKLQQAYDRERRFMFSRLRMEKNGVPIDARRLGKDTKGWQGSLQATDRWLAKRLKTPDLDVDSNDELADALENSGAVSEWILTDKGNRSTARKNIEQCIDDQQLLAVLNYRARLANGIRNFALPWLGMAETDGKIYCSWNQVRNNEGGKATVGARTGRLSSTPNFQNIPKLPDLIAFSMAEAKRLKPLAEKLEVNIMILPKDLAKHAVALPNLRDYIVPGKGFRLNIRDYSQQELRILGHFEGAVLLEAYIENPSMDIHALAQKLINGMLHTNFPRKPIKNTGFGLIYGMGVGKLAAQTGQSIEMARKLKDAYLDIFPGMGALMKELKRRARRDEPFYTWGGRIYYCEEPRKINGRMRTFDYKMLNTLIQGSAADNTKEAAIRYDELTDTGEQLILVHDEFITRAPLKQADLEMEHLRVAMESVEFDVKMLSDGKASTVSWARAKKFKEAA